MMLLALAISFSIFSSFNTIDINKNLQETFEEKSETMVRDFEEQVIRKHIEESRIKSRKNFWKSIGINIFSNILTATLPFIFYFLYILLN